MSDNDEEELTKLDAARRQLDVAIRLFLANDDEAAIHTLAAAAYRVLRDLKEKRGRSELSDLVANAAFNIARKIAHGELSDVPPGAEDLREMIMSLVEGFKSGRLQEESQVEILIAFEKRHWNEFNAVANFLKHADRDFNSTLPISSLGNMRLLEDASRAYVALAGSITDDMMAFQIWLKPEWSVLEELFGFNGEELNLLEPSARRRECMAIVSNFRQQQDTIPK